MDSSMKLSFVMIIVFGCSLLIQENSAEVICESLPTNLCSFAIASTGKRCSLGNYYNIINKQQKKKLETKCRTTAVVVERLQGPYIETDECVSACGVNRRASPNLDLFYHAQGSLCSSACYHNCPNIIDLYDNLATAGKGVNLTTLCGEKQLTKKKSIFPIQAPQIGPVGQINPNNPVVAPPYGITPPYGSNPYPYYPPYAPPYGSNPYPYYPPYAPPYGSNPYPYYPPYPPGPPPF